MKHYLTFVLLFHCSLLCICGQSAQDENSIPRIVETTPVFGQLDVDPDLSEVRVIFDQRMSGGMSLVTTAFMPEINGDVKWIDDRTLVIPVSLRPNSLCTLAFNSSKYTNFKNKKGVALNPDELMFITKSVNTNSLNREAYQKLFEIFPDYYSYSFLKGINWHDEFRKKSSAFEESNTPLEFAVTLIGILKKAEDPHLWLELDGQRFYTGKPKLKERNYGSAQIFGSLKDKKVADKFMAISGNIDSIGYISITNWSVDPDKLAFKAWGDSQNPVIPTSRVLDELMAFPNIIIDVRENGGGDERNAREIASCFTRDSVPYEIVKYYNPTTNKFDIETTKYLLPKKGGIPYQGNIFVLTGPSAMSSNESFLLMMQELQNCQLVGMRSYGSTGNPKPVDLPNGVRLYIPSWQAYTLDGELIEGNGIEPDIEIITKQEEYTREKDVLFQKVVSLIQDFQSVETEQ